MSAEEIAIKILGLDPNWVQDKMWLDNYKIIEAMKAYAMQECEKVRRECADNAKTIPDPCGARIDKQSILSTPITIS